MEYPNLMATWNSPQPLRITKTVETQEKVNGRNEKVRNFDGFVEIRQGQTIPEELMTEDFIGNALDQMMNLSPAHLAMLAAWEEKNPRLAGRWNHIKQSPGRWTSIFPPEDSILTVGAQKG